MKKNKNKKNSAKNKEEIEKEIADQLKKSLALDLEKNLDSEKTEDSELEEELNENIGDLEFHQFMRSSDSAQGKSPVLERIAASQPKPIFVGGIPQGAQRDSEESDEVRYVSSSSEKKEPKYSESFNQIYKEPERVNLDEVGRRHEGFSEINQEARFIKPQEFRSEPRIEERPWQTERIDFENVGRNPEREERKYKPKPPK